MEELPTSIAIPGSKELRGPGHTGTHDVSLGFSSLFSLCVHGSCYFLVQRSLYSISHRIHFLLHVSSVALFGIVVICFYFPVSFTLTVFHVFPFPFFHPSAQNFSAALFHGFCQSSPSFFFFFFLT